ncbi:MAG: FGGY-family carbohydrate kinase [Velocimicrobium sp.]
MKDIYIAAIDLGTSFIKIYIYSCNGDCVSNAERAVTIDNPKPDVFIQTGEYLFSAVLECFEKALKGCMHPERLKAIVFTGQMAGFMGVDKQLNDITGWSCSLDTRYYSYAVDMLKKCNKELLEIAGTNSPLMAPKIKWFENEYPKEAKKINKYLMISSYIAAKFSKSSMDEITIDSSYITWTGLADINKCQWSEKLCRAFDIDMCKLPKIVKANAILGYLDEEYCERFGLAKDIALVSGAGDKVSGIVGTSFVEKGNLIFEASSYGAISYIADSFIPNRKTKNYDILPNAMDNNFILHKYIPGSGIVLKWFVDNYCNSNSFKDMDLAASKVKPGSNGLLGIGLLNGSSMPFDEDIKGMFIGHSLAHRPEHFYRALLESYAYEIALTIDSIKELYHIEKFDSIKMIGGGASSLIWGQIIASVTNIRVDILSRSDVALWGAVLFAGEAIGAFEDVQAISKKNISTKKCFYPMKEDVKKYQKYKELYNKMIRETKIYYKEIKDIEA